MLFDLRSPRRRVAIKFIYGTLAVLMGGGLIFFGIGSDASGGLSEVFGGGNADSGFEDQIEEAEKQGGCSRKAANWKRWRSRIPACR